MVKLDLKSMYLNFQLVLHSKINGYTYDSDELKAKIERYDDRVSIWSPGGMFDGTTIQEHDIFNIESTNRKR